MVIGRRLTKISKLETDVTVKKVKLELAEERPWGLVRHIGQNTSISLTVPESF